MTERLIQLQIHWSEPDGVGVRTFLGVTPFTRNEDGSDPAPVFVPKAFMLPQLVAALETSAFPALTAARAARVAALEPADQRAARLLEEATAAKAAIDAEIAAKQAELAALQVQINRTEPVFEPALQTTTP